MGINRRNFLRQAVIGSVAAGLFMGTGIPYAYASSSAFTITKPDYRLTDSIDYSGVTGGKNPISVVYVSPAASNGRITIASASIKGDFTSNADDDSKGFDSNSNGILAGNGYKGLSVLKTVRKSVSMDMVTIFMAQGYIQQIIVQQERLLQILCLTLATVLESVIRLNPAMQPSMVFIMKKAH